MKTALRCRVRFSRYVLWLWAKWIKITLFFLAIGPAARRQGGSAVFWKVIPDFFWIYKSKIQYNFIIFTKKSQEKNSGFSKIIWKFLIFVKNSPRKIKRKRVSDRFCLSYRTKYQNGEIYPTIGRCGICFFACTAFFRRGVFPTRRFFARARTCMWAYARTHTPVQRMRIYYWREKNEISAVGGLWFFCGAFSSGELPKSKIAEFSGENSAEPYKIPVKSWNLAWNGWETAFCGDERAIFVRKNGKTAKSGEKKEKKKKNEKKLKNFKKRRKNSWQGVYKCGIIVKLTNERTSTAGRTPVKQAD